MSEREEVGWRSKMHVEEGKGRVRMEEEDVCRRGKR